MSQITDQSFQESVRTNSMAYYSIFAVSFVVFLSIALVAQMLFLRWRSWFPGAEGGKTLIGDVKAAVYTFMSQLT
jgi:light-harvesting complex 1 beta chain